jgi:hypothetical protein
MRACLNQIENCPLKENRRKAVSHHLYYYRRDYPTPLEQAFRNAPVLICWSAVSALKPPTRTAIPYLNRHYKK